MSGDTVENVLLPATSDLLVPGFQLVHDNRWLHVAGACQHFLDDEDIDALWFSTLESNQAPL